MRTAKLCLAMLAAAALTFAAYGAAQRAQQKPAAKVGALSDFAWLAGKWEGKLGQMTAEQTWLGPKAGIMVGAFRLSDGEKVAVVEFFSLLETPEGIVLRLRHFLPDLVPLEKDQAIYMKLVKAEPGRFEFDNPVNAQPKRAVFTVIDRDTYNARAEIVRADGRPDVIDVTYHRVQ